MNPKGHCAGRYIERYVDLLYLAAFREPEVWQVSDAADFANRAGDFSDGDGWVRSGSRRSSQGTSPPQVSSQNASNGKDSTEDLTCVVSGIALRSLDGAPLKSATVTAKAN